MESPKAWRGSQGIAGEAYRHGEKKLPVWASALAILFLAVIAYAALGYALHRVLTQ